MTKRSNKKNPNAKKVKNQSGDRRSDRFLASLGITPLGREVYSSKEYLDQIEASGMSREQNFDDPNSPAAGRYYFANEAVARATLGGDYERISQTIQTLDNLEPDSLASRKIADLGGGSGIMGLFVARKCPDAQVTVFDWAQSPLDIGSCWAKKLGLTNISFSRRSYSEIASATDLEFDLILCNHAIHGSWYEGTLPHHWRDLLWPDLEVHPKARSAKMFTKAIRSLANGRGTAMITCPIRFPELTIFFETCRESGLGIDWRYTYLKTISNNEGPAIEDICIFLKPDLPSICASAFEDAQGLFACRDYFGRVLDVGWGAFEGYSGLFSSGRKLFEVELDSRSSVIDRFAVYAKSGLIFTEITSTTGSCRGRLTSIAIIYEEIGYIEQSIKAHLDQSIARISFAYVDPDLELMLDEWDFESRVLEAARSIV